MPFDYGHVQEKLTQWYDRWAAHNLEGYTGRLDSSVVKIQVPEWLINRLARANIKRRKQLRYWRQHADAPESTPVAIKIEPKVDKQPPLLPTSEIDNETSKEANKRPAAKSEMTRTTNTKVSFSTAVVSEVKHVHEDDTAHTQYEESVVGKFTSTRVPPVPQASEKSEDFTCPYCGLELKSTLMKHRRAWKYATTVY